MSSLNEKYDMVEGTVVLSGTEALARLPLEQRQRDQRNGLNTGGFICGYRGSPLGTYDLELWRIQERLTAVNVRFQPGINEDLAATAVWGTQYVNLYPVRQWTAYSASGTARRPASSAAPMRCTTLIQLALRRPVAFSR